MRVTLIHNPSAGDPGTEDAERLVAMIRAAGHEVVAHASAAGDVWHEALRDPGDLVAVAGGDGTVGRVARRMVGRDVPITFLPQGTANNISKTFGLGDFPLEHLVAGWQRAEVRALDVGAIDGPWGSRHFLEGVGAGLFARTMREIDSRDALAHLESADDRVAHALGLMGARLRACPAIPLRLQLDGRDLSGEYLMLEVMNIRFVGPNLFVAPESDPSDGLLDVVLVKPSERDDLHGYLANWRSGGRRAPDLTTHRGRHLRVEWPDTALHVDDESWPPAGAAAPSAPTVLELHVEPGALRMLIPAV